MKLKNIDLKAAQKNWEWDGRPYLVKYLGEVFVSHAKEINGWKIYFDDVKNKRVVLLEHVEELAVIQ